MFDALEAYSGFGTETPLLVESPAAYVRRLRSSYEAMILPPCAEDPLSMMVVSPAMILPFPFRDGTERVVSSAVGYPLLHVPVQHAQPFKREPLGLWALTVILACAMTKHLDLIPGDTTVYVRPVQKQWDLPEDLWSLSREIAHDLYIPLTMVNLGRLAVHATDSTEDDRVWRNLTSLWNIHESRQHSIEQMEMFSPALEKKLYMLGWR